jgi:hypothetical protein
MAPERPAAGVDMPGKVPQKPSSKKAGKSLKEKRAAKHASHKTY